MVVGWWLDGGWMVVGWWLDGGWMVVGWWLDGGFNHHPTHFEIFRNSCFIVLLLEERSVVIGVHNHHLHVHAAAELRVTSH